MDFGVFGVAFVEESAHQDAGVHRLACWCRRAQLASRLHSKSNTALGMKNLGFLRLNTTTRSYSCTSPAHVNGAMTTPRGDLTSHNLPHRLTDMKCTLTISGAGTHQLPRNTNSLHIGERLPLPRRGKVGRYNVVARKRPRPSWR